MRKALLAFAIWVALGAYAHPGHDRHAPIVHAESQAIRAVYSQPLTADIPKLRVALHILNIGGDQPLANALDRYLTEVAFLRVAGEPEHPSGTIGDLIAKPQDAARMSQLSERIFATTLEPSIVRIPKAPQDHALVIMVNIRNAGAKRVEQFDARLHIGTATLSCRVPGRALASIDAGGTVLHECEMRDNPADLAKALESIGAVASDPSSSRLEVSRLVFSDPPVAINPGFAVWLGDTSFQQAVAELTALSCGQRAACWHDLTRLGERNPGWLTGFVFAIFGSIAGALIRRFARHPVRWTVAAIVVHAILWGAATAALLAMNSLMGLVVGIGGLSAIVGFTVGMIAGQALTPRRAG